MLGIVHARRVDDAYGMGCYLNPLTTKGKSGMNGKSTKYDRLGFYPASRQIVWHSNGMKKPTVRSHPAEECDLADLLEGYDIRTEYPLRSADGRVVGTCIKATRHKSR